MQLRSWFDRLFRREKYRPVVIDITPGKLFMFGGKIYKVPDLRNQPSIMELFAGGEMQKPTDSKFKMKCRYIDKDGNSRDLSE